MGEELPSWRDERPGAMVRCALWLLSEVGVGNIFTKAELREAFPETAQIDRRMRDLRDRGWRIDTNRDDPTLRTSEQRFVEKGAEVWKPGQSRAHTTGVSVTATRRLEVFAADDYMCRVCGIAGGDAYEDGNGIAQLDIARREVRKSAGRTEVELVTECRRCRVGGQGSQADPDKLLGEIRRMSEIEREHFAQWVADDQRDFSTMERLWGAYRRLPAESRQTVQAAMKNE
ncbi:hypothetical protein [Streptomyces sp. H27-D2]|uniref:hypothetical protein n=1 Tax=Streptomyces sp. H27-D2 TaxID=3046304 RepID=UPI002DBD9384|nr:hypothetical protein [Streptomyces sp. H27-D2]MEC4018126.1 hypothetical protein [Streptomyces sp. H27-D2]